MSLFSAQTVVGKLLRLPLRLIPPGSVVPILATKARGKRWIVGSGPHSCWLGFNEISKRRLFSRHVKSGSVVYDIGANVGSYTILSSVLVGHAGRVVAFEPLPENLRYLREHVKINNLKNVDIMEGAVSDRTGMVHFDTGGDRVLGHISTSGDIEVRTLALDKLVENETIPPPHFMKIDVEGAEALVLKGAIRVLRLHHPALFLATHGEAIKRECLSILAEHKYRIENIGGRTDELFATWVRND